MDWRVGLHFPTGKPPEEVQFRFVEKILR